MLKKKLAGIVLVGAIVCSVPVVAFAENVQGDAAVASSTSKFHPMKQLLLEKAQAYGIATDGKTNKEIKTELKAAAVTKLQAKATEAGIATDGKTGKEIRTALKAAKEAKKAAKQAKKSEAVNKKAAKLGISTDGKTTEQVYTEIESALQAKWAKKAAK
ncbi:hypothetical protein [Paenibacillus sp. Soil750]|uniref:hypothetical protein n=1 Tax=Paenibacillus sp. Soil750 TaxID=1736398 RepID=UPI0006F7C951|nr:hypothetical protein [Paenibacillus sp. Soil750]KRE58266.1 hypothetical protein ASL11_28270 [Paenibacillus sp. Soil750]